MLAPYVDSPRTKWEDHLFGPSYKNTELHCRPKYGALHLMGHQYGPAPRFGSCYFLLAPEYMRSATFCFGDSATEPRSKGTVDAFDMILASLFERCFTDEQALGFFGLRPPSLFTHLINHSPNTFKTSNEVKAIPNLDQYIEAQVHNEITLSNSVFDLVVDPSYRGTSIGDTLINISTRYNFPIRWHDGFRLRVDQVVDDFRGGKMPALAHKIARNGYIDAATIGRALAEAELNSSGWEFDEPPQRLLKYLWHVLVRFGGSWNHN